MEKYFRDSRTRNFLNTSCFCRSFFERKVPEFQKNPAGVKRILNLFF